MYLVAVTLLDVSSLTPSLDSSGVLISSGMYQKNNCFTTEVGASVCARVCVYEGWGDRGVWGGGVHLLQSLPSYLTAPGPCTLAHWHIDHDGFKKENYSKYIYNRY